MVKNLPFIEDRIDALSDERVIRIFEEFTNPEDLKWHWDEEDRVIEPLHKTDWLFQFDNKLPQSIQEKIKIPKGKWHRIIKGSGKLSLVVEKIKNI